MEVERDGAHVRGDKPFLPPSRCAKSFRVFDGFTDSPPRGKVIHVNAYPFCARPVAAPLLAAVSHPGPGRRGRIPIPFTSPPTTPVIISTPGQYILTRNLVPTGPGDTIRISLPAGGGSVDLDLNGFSLQGTNALANGIEVLGPAGAFDVRIHDGTIEGGGNSISVTSAPRKLVIERVGARDATLNGISVGNAPKNVVIRDCVLSGTPGAGVGINLRGSQALIEGNEIHTWQIGMFIGTGGTATIVKNLVRATTSEGIRLFLNLPTLVSENTIRTDGGTIGISVISTSGCKIFDNITAVARPLL
jgi:hypothetical protein